MCEIKNKKRHPDLLTPPNSKLRMCIDVLRTFPDTIYMNNIIIAVKDRILLPWKYNEFYLLLFRIAVMGSKFGVQRQAVPMIRPLSATS